MKTKAQIIEEVIDDAVKVNVQDEAQIIMLRRGLLKMIDPAKEPIRIKVQQEIENCRMRIDVQSEGIEVLKDMLEKENNPKSVKL